MAKQLDLLNQVSVSYIIDVIRHSGQAHPSKYAANSNAEDFAESVKGYAMDKDSFAKQFPARSGILDRIFGVV